VYIVDIFHNHFTTLFWNQNTQTGLFKAEFDKIIEGLERDRDSGLLSPSLYQDSLDKHNAAYLGSKVIRLKQYIDMLITKLKNKGFK